MLRLIMYLTATNCVTWPLEGIIGAMPYPFQWRSLILGPDEELLWSYDDMKGAFYLFKLPDSWAPLFAFNVCFSAEELGLEEDKYKEGGVYLGAVTMPMGYLNAMGLVQYLHRRLLARGPQRPDGLLRSREIRKDRPVPALRPHSPLRVFGRSSATSQTAIRGSCEKR